MPLQMAASNRMANVLRLLLRAGAVVSLFNYRNELPLQIFIKNSPKIEDYEDKNSISESFKLLIEGTDVNLKDRNGKNAIQSYLEHQFEPILIYQMKPIIIDVEHIKKFVPKIIEQVAMLKTPNLKVDVKTAEIISCKQEHSNHYKKCIEELEQMKKTKLNECWVTLFNLLVEDESRLIKYSGNQNLIVDFEKRVKMFPIYENWMRIKIAEGIEGRKFYDGAANIMSYYLPIFNPLHLVVRDIVDTLRIKL